MEQKLTIRGRYIGRTFIPDGQLPETEGTAELIITPTRPQERGSIAEAFGSAPVLRNQDEILAQVATDRDEWGDR